MNRLNWLSILVLIFLLSLVCASYAFAADVKGASVTVYNSGRALVKEARSVNLPAGLASVVFRDVPATMDPTSVHASAEDMTVREIQYSYVPITTQNLLKRYLGKELTVVMPDPSGADARILRKATLASIAEGPVFLVGKEVYAGDYDALLFPELPKDLQREPTLTLTTNSGTQGKRDVLLSYLMSGLNWRADYTLHLDPSGDTGALDAWATITNTSRRGFAGADIKLVAGEVRQERGPVRHQYAKATGMSLEMADAAAPEPEREQFSQFHVYSVGRPVNLSESGTRQISLFSTPKMAIRQELISSFRGGGQLRGTSKQGVDLKLTLENTDANGLGRPMPGGLVRVFMSTADGSMLLAGESRMGHVATGGEVSLSLGRSFDVTVERSQSSFKKLGRNSYELGWRIEVRNGSRKNQALTLNDYYSGQWRIIDTDRQYTRPDSGSLRFALDVPPTPDGTPVVINYTVQVTY